MKLKKLELDNFRGFEHFAAEFNDRLTVIAGDNGAGKSSLLDAAAIAAGAFLLGLDGIPSIGILKEDAMKKSFEMGSVVDLQPQFPVRIKAEGVIHDHPIQWMRELNGLDGRTTVRDAKQIITLSAEYQKQVRAGNKNVILPLISYYGTGRLWAQKKDRSAISPIKQFNRLMGYIDCLSAESSEKLMLKWFEKMTMQQLQMQKELPELTVVRKAIAACFREASDTQDVDVIFNLSAHSLEVFYQENGVSKRMPLKNLSDGYKDTLSMIADIAYRMAVLNPQLLEQTLELTPGIVLIDEIDLHLHPRWQQRILSDLQHIFPKIQFIVTTHAPSVINSVDRENVLLMKHFHEAEIPSIETYGTDVNSILTHIMDASDRPQHIKELFNQFYAALDEENLEQSELLLNQLKNTIAANDPELTQADTALTLEKM